MIRGITVENFKCFRDRQVVPFRPLTMIYGPNSAGKTALLQTLLLYCQSFESNELKYDGKYTNLIGYDNCAFNSGTIKLGYLSENPYGTALEIDSNGIKKHIVNSSKYQFIYTYNNNSKILYVLNRNDVKLFKLYTINYLEEHSLFSYFCPKNSDYTFRMLVGYLKVSDDDAAEGLELAGHDDLYQSKEIPGILDLLGKEDYNGIYRRTMSTKLKSKPNIDNYENSLLKSYNTVCKLYGHPINYLGPTRYEYNDRILYIDHKAVSTKGEQLLVNIYNCEYKADKINRVNEELLYMNVNYTFDIINLSNKYIGNVICPIFKSIHTGKKHQIKELGFGIRQVIPILLSKYQNPEHIYDTTIIQQPELHLHPKMQGDLLDIIMNIDIPPDKAIHRDVIQQWILETHSEAMLYRLQRRIREGKIKAEDVAILYVEPQGDGSSKVHHLKMDEKGYFIDEWPGDFFEQQFDDLFGE